MNRGEIWTVARGPDFAVNPRPAIIVQADEFRETTSVTICPLTTTLPNADTLRPEVAPTATNGLTQVSQVMVDKITTVPLSKVGTRLGSLSATEIAGLEQSLLVFLGLAGTGA